MESMIRDRSITVEELHLVDGESVLEVGCGYGWITEALLGAAKIRWTGLDRSESMVAQLRARLSAYRASAFVGDACRLPFPANSFDKVLCTGVLMHVTDDHAALAKIARVLKPGGLLVCSVNNAISPYSLPVRFHNSSKKGFTELSASGNVPRIFSATRAARPANAGRWPVCHRSHQHRPGFVSAKVRF